jgi:hypothetical protein
MLATTVIAWLGYLIHNVVEFSPLTFVSADTLVPTAMTVACLAWWWTSAGHKAATNTFLCWTLLNLIGGSG